LWQLLNYQIWVTIGEIGAIESLGNTAQRI
jgi:hypothetical protein